MKVGANLNSQGYGIGMPMDSDLKWVILYRSLIFQFFKSEKPNLVSENISRSPALVLS